MIAELQKILPPDRIRTRLIDRVSFASDAGFYYLVPKAIVLPASEEEIIALFRLSRELKMPMVFRAAGTSLSGQAITDGILVDLSRYWNKVSVEEEGRSVRVQPGIIGGMVNVRLRKYGKKIGPDPSSIGSAMMGGILSNNASGMCCGVVQNSYHTLKHIRFILPDGKSFSTEGEGEKERFVRECPDLAERLSGLRQRVMGDPVLFDRIRAKYKMKNTVGYSLNALVDHEHPLDILSHLLVGAEGTLAFISEAVMHTVDDPPCKSTSLLLFPDIRKACAAIVPLADAGAAMVELMDRASLRSVEDMKGMPDVVKSLPETAAALLVEFQEADEGRLESRVEEFMGIAGQLSLHFPPSFTRDPEQREFLWKVRKGLYPAVGAVRASGTTVLLEDIAFPVHRLGDAIQDLHELFRLHGYEQAIIVGHAKDGNLHFMIPQACNTPEEIARYDRFLRDVVDLVVRKYDGALKAEHGTGRNMAPFVETEWGPEAYAIIRAIKDAVDPDRLLNPGVIVNDDPEAHLKNFKLMPTVEEEVDKCVECGFCESVCPSRDLTATPRRRIVIRRVLQNMLHAGDQKEYEQLLKEYDYDGLDTCAVDGLCASACPVGINTGDLVKRLRRESHSAKDNARALWVARHFGQVESTVRAALGVGSFFGGIFGNGALGSLTGGMRKLFPDLPLWSNQLLPPPDLSVLKSHPALLVRDKGIVYFPSCISRTLGSYNGRKNIMQTFLDLCSRADIGVSVLDGFEGSCCSQIFSSKGYGDAQRHMANHIVDKLWRSSGEGRLAVVIDVSSCAYTLHHIRPSLGAENRKRFDKLTILDSVEFLHDRLMPRVKVNRRMGKVLLHPVCSLKKMGTEDKFRNLAAHFADEVVVPINAGCCGMAGDRGFIVPELTASATRIEAGEASSRKYDGYYSSTKTCEMAMSEAVKENYESILYLIEEATR
jgi:D-lactate dehydrogenase